MKISIALSFVSTLRTYSLGKCSKMSIEKEQHRRKRTAKGLGLKILLIFDKNVLVDVDPPKLERSFAHKAGGTSE